MMTRYRLSHGLHWLGKYPGWDELRHVAYALLFVAMLLSAWTAVEAFAEATERAIHAERAADVLGAQAKALRNCEAGASGYYYETDGRAYQCGGRL